MNFAPFAALEIHRPYPTAAARQALNDRTHQQSEASVLSAKQILAMPADAYMNRQQLDFFRERLLQMRRELSSRIEARKCSASPVTAPPDPVDRATIEEERFLLEQLDAHESAQLRQVDQALERIREGRYGYCAQTGEPIGLRRLLAQPETALAADAENLAEARAAHSAAKPPRPTGQR